MDKPDPKGALAAILQQNLSKNPELAAKQRRLLELLRQQQRQQQQGLGDSAAPNADGTTTKGLSPRT